MLVRLLAGGMLVLSLVATDGAALADSAEGRMFKGRTAQGYRIKIAVKDGVFKLQRFNMDLRCRDGSQLELQESGFLWTKAKGNGAFHDAQFGKTDSVYFRGHLSGRRIRGQIRVTDKEKRGPQCASHWVGFNATPR